MKDAAEADLQCKLLKKTILDGWPDLRKECPVAILEYCNHRDELTVLEDIIMKGDRIVIPKPLQKDMLHRVHYSHLGIEKCKQLARDIIFWPGMCSEIEKLIQGCQEKQNANAKEPLLPRKIPERPWQIVASDLFSLEKVNYVIVVDYYSRFFEIERLKDTLSSTVVKKTKVIFSRHGIPEELVSDNSPQFISQEYKQFTSEWDIVHTMSSPEYPQSNGLAEKAVQTAKNILQKAINDKKDPY